MEGADVPPMFIPADANVHRGKVGSLGVLLLGVHTANGFGLGALPTGLLLLQHLGGWFDGSIGAVGGALLEAWVWHEHPLSSTGLWMTRTTWVYESLGGQPRSVRGGTGRWGKV